MYTVIENKAKVLHTVIENKAKVLQKLPVVDNKLPKQMKNMPQKTSL